MLPKEWIGDLVGMTQKLDCGYGMYVQWCW